MCGGRERKGDRREVDGQHQTRPDREGVSVEESQYLTRFNKIAIQGTPQMAVD